MFLAVNGLKHKKNSEPVYQNVQFGKTRTRALILPQSNYFTYERLYVVFLLESLSAMSFDVVNNLQDISLQTKLRRVNHL